MLMRTPLKKGDQEYILLRMRSDQSTLNWILTQIKLCYGPVAVQFGIQFIILAIHFNSFRVQVNGLCKIPFRVFFIAFSPVNLCSCWIRRIERFVNEREGCDLFSTYFYAKTYIKIKDYPP